MKQSCDADGDQQSRVGRETTQLKKKWSLSTSPAAAAAAGKKKGALDMRRRKRASPPPTKKNVHSQMLVLERVADSACGAMGGFALLVALFLTYKNLL